jgi:hypothetical protein
MIDKLIFDDIDPNVCEYRRDWRGRFTSGGGGSISARGGNVRVSGAKRKTSYATRNMRKGKKAYVYRVGKGGKVLRAPKAGMARHVSQSLVLRRTPPGARLNRSGSVRYISRGHERTRLFTRPAPGNTYRLAGRAHSASVVSRATRGAPLKPGYVVAYGKPLPGS